MCKCLETGRKVKFVQCLTQKSTSKNFLIFFFVISVSNYFRNNGKNSHLLHDHVLTWTLKTQFWPKWIFNSLASLRFCKPGPARIFAENRATIKNKKLWNLVRNVMKWSFYNARDIPLYRGRKFAGGGGRVFFCKLFLKECVGRFWWCWAQTLYKMSR